MRYAALIENDISDSTGGICVSFWFQGCPFHCKGCFNEDTWPFTGGKELPENYLEVIDEAITRNGILRNFSVLGGEPLCKENRELAARILEHVRVKFPTINIICWTGYTYEELLAENDVNINIVLSNIDTLVDGQFILEKKDITLKLRGSSNQRIIHFKDGKFFKIEE